MLILGFGWCRRFQFEWVENSRNQLARNFTGSLRMIEVLPGFEIPTWLQLEVSIFRVRSS